MSLHLIVGFQPCHPIKIAHLVAAFEVATQLRALAMVPCSLPVVKAIERALFLMQMPEKVTAYFVSAMASPMRSTTVSNQPGRANITM